MILSTLDVVMPEKLKWEGKIPKDHSLYWELVSIRSGHTKNKHKQIRQILSKGKLGNEEEIKFHFFSRRVPKKEKASLPSLRLLQFWRNCKAFLSKKGDVTVF